MADCGIGNVKGWGRGDFELLEIRAVLALLVFNKICKVSIYVLWRFLNDEFKVCCCLFKVYYREFSRRSFIFKSYFHDFRILKFLFYVFVFQPMFSTT